MRLNPVFESLGSYPFTRLDDAMARARADGIELIDFGPGVPREQVPKTVRDAFTSPPGISTYPLSPGISAAREAVADWIKLRFGPELDPATEIIPTLGSKEPIYSLAQIVGGEVVACTSPGYPVPERGALFAGKEVVRLPLTRENQYLPDLEQVPWERLSILWLNYPNNPTGATVTVEYLERAAELARRHDAIVACDEAYSEIWFEGDPPCSGLQIEDRTNLIVFNTLSKRSAMPGYRAGFAAGDPELIAAMKRYRPHVGVTPQEAVQRAMIAAYADESHVEQARARYRVKRDVLLPALQAAGLEHVGGHASLYLWMRTPDADEEDFVLSMLQRGVVCSPGSFFGPGGSGHVRFAVVPDLADCERAAELLTA